MFEILSPKVEPRMFTMNTFLIPLIRSSTLPQYCTKQTKIKHNTRLYVSQPIEIYTIRQPKDVHDF